MGGKKEIYRDIRFFHRAIHLSSPVTDQRITPKPEWHSVANSGRRR